MKRARRSVLPVSAVLTLCALPGLARADINTFSDLATNWTINQNDAAVPPSYAAATDTLHLTPPTFARRSVFHESPQPVGAFSASFVYQAQNIVNPASNLGACFVLQNSPAGPSALGETLGYSGIGKSVALSLQLTGTGLSGIYANGALGGGSLPTEPVNLLSGHPIQVSLSYANGFLDVSFLDLQTLDQHQAPSTIIDIPALIGSPNAYVGFTAGSGSVVALTAAADQYFSGVHFTGIPEPATGLAVAAGLLASMLRRR
jgi:hypothetical protein